MPLFFNEDMKSANAHEDATKVAYEDVNKFTYCGRVIMLYL